MLKILSFNKTYPTSYFNNPTTIFMSGRTHEKIYITMIRVDVGEIVGDPEGDF